MLFFAWGEGVTKILGLKLDKVWSSFSNEGISFSIEHLSFSNEGISFLNEESSLQVSESNEKHDSKIENAIKFEVSSWSKVSDEDYESRFSIFLVNEKDDSLELFSLMWLEEWELE